jgi:diguanylate cyclase (GGDEF)-like protein/PAS domain S-box-containing protein
MGKKDLDNRFFSVIVEDLEKSVRFFDKERNILYINPYGEKLTGWGAEEIVGKKCGSFEARHTDRDGSEICEVSCPLDFSLKEGTVFDGHYSFKGKDGVIFPVGVKVLPVTGSGGEIMGVVEIMTDDRPKLEMEDMKRDIQRLIPVDILTGLYIKDKIMEYFEVKVENSRRYGSPLGIVVVSIEDMASIRKSFGDKKVDEVLQRVGYLIRMNTRRGDISGRLGPEEFLMLLPNTLGEDTYFAAEKLKKIIMEDSNLVLPGKVSVKVGTAQYNDGDDISSLLDRAKAEATGRG